MPEYDWQLSAGAPLCTVSDSFYRTVREAIFQQLTKETTPVQFQAALEHLVRLRDELQPIRPMHYGSLVGGHRCVEHLFKEADARLRALEIMQPAPPPPAPEAPAPQPKPRSLADVVKDFAATPEEASLPHEDNSE